MATGMDTKTTTAGICTCDQGQVRSTLRAHSRKHTCVCKLEVRTVHKRGEVFNRLLFLDAGLFVPEFNILFNMKCVALEIRKLDTAHG